MIRARPRGVAPMMREDVLTTWIMHLRAARNHPSVLGEVMNHPALMSTLAPFATHELSKFLDEKQ